MDKDARIKELEMAIIAANNALRAGEGINLLYYLDEEDAEAFRVIKSVIDDEAEERLPQMAYTTNQIPETVRLRDCPLCLAPPQISRAERDGFDVWAIVCPDCGLQMIGNRVEGIGLDGLNMVEVTKPGDDFDELVALWNNLKAAEAGKGGKS